MPSSYMLCGPSAMLTGEGKGASSRSVASWYLGMRKSRD